MAHADAPLRASASARRLPRLFIGAGLAALVVAGCTTTPPSRPPEPIPLTPPKDVPSAPVVREPIAPAPQASVPTAPLPSAAQPDAMLPANTLYRCVTEAGGQRQQTAIEFVPKVLELCRKHPEMGPCQYEREVCRRAGGRVFTANGAEITRHTEAEYDKRVMRVRFRGD